MGKILAIGFIIIVIVVIIAGVVVYFRRKKGRETALDRGWAINGDLNTRQERALLSQVTSAAILFRRLLVAPPDLAFDDITLLREEDRQKIMQWLVKNGEITDSIAEDFARKGKSLS